jgi:hypothetical protein
MKLTRPGELRSLAAYPQCSADNAGSAEPNPANRMTPRDAIEFVERHGVVLQAARGMLPNLAEVIAGERIRGSWWSHPKGNQIFHIAEAVSDSPDILVCKLVQGKVTYIHRRLWPALVKLAPRFRRAQLAKVWSEHTPSGAHRACRQAFPDWVPADVTRKARALSIDDAEALLSPVLACQKKGTLGERRSRRTRS